MLLALIAVIVALAQPPAADARGKGRECKPSGVPVALGMQGTVEMMESIESQGEARVLTVDRLAKPDKLRLISSSGEATELSKPPWTVELSRWLARGQAIYGIGTSRSYEQGKTDVVLVRWGMDSRPHLQKLATVDAVDAPPHAALIEEFMAVTWSQRDADGKSHVKLVFIDMEELRAGAVQELGARAQSGLAEITGSDRKFTAVWSSEAGIMRASFDVHGKVIAPAGALQWPGASNVRAAITCHDRVWLLHDASADEVALSASDPSGNVGPIARLPAAPVVDSVPMRCEDDAVVIAHRTVSPKQGNVVFWISTVEASGKAHERRVKDVQGTADDMRLLQLAAARGGYSAFWIEGAGAAAKLWSRPVVCDGGS